MSYFTTVIDKFVGLDALSDGSITRTYVEDAVSRAMNSATRWSQRQSTTIDHSVSDSEFYKMASQLIKNTMQSSKHTFTEKAPRTIHLVDEKAYFDMVKNMLSARTSLSPYDVEIVKFTIDNFNQSEYMPSKIQFRETQAMIDNYNFTKGYLHNIDIRTVADFERLLVSLSDGDISLSQKQMIRNFSNQERKKLFEIFNNSLRKNWPTMLESAANRQTLRFMNNVLKGRLHFNTMVATDQRGMKNRDIYSQFARAAKEKENTMSIYEKNMKAHNYLTAARVLAKHSPTLFIQHAKEIVGKASVNLPKSTASKEVSSIVKLIEDCAKKVDIKTSLSLKKEVLKEPTPYKIMFPKGSSLRVVVKENKSIDLTPDLQDDIVVAISSGIKQQLAKQEMTGTVKIDSNTKIYIDPDLKDCPIPTVGRNDSGKNRTVAPGTRLPVEKCDILRAALYKQNDRNQFIDFSCGFLDKNFKLVGQTSWNNLQQRAGGQAIAYHSGDTNYCSGKGCTEIIDIDLKAVQQKFQQARYVAYTAIMWEGNPLSSCNQLFMTLAPTMEMGKVAGIDLDTKNSKISVYDPANVQFKVDITGDGFMSIPMLYDIETGKAMVVNIDSKNKDFQSVAGNVRHFDLPKGCECLENYATDLGLKCFAYSQLDVPTIYELAMLHAVSKHATFVRTPEEADVIFATDRTEYDDLRVAHDGEELRERVVVTPFDKDIITAELIPDPKTLDTQDAANREQTTTYSHVDLHSDGELYHER
jgi:hypothetical protein